MHLKDLGNLTSAISSFVKTGSLAGRVNDVLAVSFKDLNAAQILAKVSILKITDAQKLELVSKYAVDKANYSNIASIKTLSATQKEATASTLGLGTAFKGLGASIKSFVMDNPALTFAALAAAAVTAGVAIYANIHPSLFKSF